MKNKVARMGCVSDHSIQNIGSLAMYERCKMMSNGAFWSWGNAGGKMIGLTNASMFCSGCFEIFRGRLKEPKLE